MYIRKKLIKAINEAYYRNHQDTTILPLKEDSTVTDIIRNMTIIKPNNVFSVELYNMHVDLHALSINFFNYNEEMYKSKLAQELMNNRQYLEDIITHKLPVTDVYEEVVNILSRQSTNACLVGGFIRDAIMGYNSKDIDFATDTPYDELQVAFREEGFTLKEEGKEFLVLIVSKNDEMYEIANFRKDVGGSDGRHPDSVEIGTIRDDAHRRDFTINALYYNLRSRKLIDPTGYGIEDLEGTGILRFVGNPKDRLEEDALRLWRAYRLASTKGLDMERRTERALRENFDECYKRSNPQRVLQEMIKL